jgi:hypothetical protein
MEWRRHSITAGVAKSSLNWFEWNIHTVPPRPHATRVFTKFRILEISYISYVFLNFVYYSKVQQFRENNRNFSITGVRIDSVQIYQFSIAKIITFFIDTSANVV